MLVLRMEIIIDLFLLQKLSKAVGFKLSDEDKCIQERKRIRILENRIEHSVQRFDKTLARNAKHRQNIELITTERKRYSGKP